MILWFRSLMHVLDLDFYAQNAKSDLPFILIRIKHLWYPFGAFNLVFIWIGGICYPSTIDCFVSGFLFWSLTESQDQLNSGVRTAYYTSIYITRFWVDVFRRSQFSRYKSLAMCVSIICQELITYLAQRFLCDSVVLAVSSTQT